MRAEDSEIRLANFKALWDAQRWTPALLASNCGSSASQWSDLYYGRKSFGEKIARKIESGMNLVRLSLDDPEGARFQPLSAEVFAKLAQLDPSQIRLVENSIRGMLDLPPLAPSTAAPPAETPAAPAPRPTPEEAEQVIRDALDNRAAPTPTRFVVTKNTTRRSRPTPTKKKGKS